MRYPRRTILAGACACILCIATIRAADNDNTDGLNGVVRAQSAKTLGKAKINVGLGVDFEQSSDYVQGPTWNLLRVQPDDSSVAGGARNAAKLVTSEVHLAFGLLDFCDLGVALPLYTRIDDARPKVVVWASCGIEPSGVIPYKPLVDRALEAAQWHVERTVLFARPQQHAELVQGRDEDWDKLVASAEPAECVAVEATDPLYILYTSGRAASPRGWCATTAATQWPCSGPCGASTTRAGRCVLGRLGHGLGGRPLLHRLRAAAGRRHHGDLRGQAGGHAGRRCVLARRRRTTASRCCSPRPRRSVPSGGRTPPVNW